MTGFYLKSSVPAAGDEDVASNTTISLTFSEPVDLKKAAPVLSPDIGGKWVQASPTKLAYRLDSPFVPSTQETVTLPGGTSGLRATTGPSCRAVPRSPSTWRPATCCGCRSCWPGWTTCP